MKIISRKKQIECIKRLKAIRIITDDMNWIANKEDAKRWCEDVEYLAVHILEIAGIIDGVKGILVVAPTEEVSE